MHARLIFIHSHVSFRPGITKGALAVMAVLLWQWMVERLWWGFGNEAARRIQQGATTVGRRERGGELKELSCLG